MEFKYYDSQNGRTTLPPSHPLSAATYVSRSPLLGCEFASGGFSDNVPMPRVFPIAVPINAEEAFQRELEKEEIRREIIVGEMAMARRRDLEEEVRREIASEKSFEIPMQRSEGISFNKNNFNRSGQPRIRSNSHFLNGSRRAFTRINKDKVTQLAGSNAYHCGRKRKAVRPTGYDNESLKKKVKQEWRCKLCQITTTSEKALNDHFQGKKHKAKASMRTQKIGLDSRPQGQKIHPCLTPIHTQANMKYSREEDQVVNKSKGLGGLDNQNETAYSKETWETNASKEEI